MNVSSSFKCKLGHRTFGQVSKASQLKVLLLSLCVVKFLIDNKGTVNIETCELDIRIF